MNGWLNSFRFAFAGIITTLKTQRNMRFHIFAAVAVLAFSVFAGLTRTEWALIVFSIGLVVSAELMNTAVEAAVNLFTQNHHPLAKIAKDAAAGAVLVAAFVSVVIGWLVLYPRLGLMVGNVVKSIM